MLANGTGSSIVKNGGDTWFFLTADYAFGLALERDTEAVVLKNGGKVLGKVRHPLNTQDFSSFLLQAQASKAKIIGLANAGGDTTNSIKQAAEFRHRQGRPESGRFARVPDRHPRAWPRHGTGPDHHQYVLLGHERSDARLSQALRRAR
jgi:branched-chain amino acid transport system substrate-binding protein